MFLGGGSNSCLETTMPRPRRARIKSGVNGAAASTSTYSAPPASAASRICRRSSSDPWKPPALPARPAGDDDRPVTPLERRPHVRPVDGLELVEAQLDQVRVGGVPCGAQGRHGRLGDRGTEKGVVDGHNWLANNKKASAADGWEASFEADLRLCRLAEALPS